MPDRIIGHARHSRDECPCHPTVPVVLHDEHESMPERLLVAAVQAAHPKRTSEPPEITAAREAACSPYCSACHPSIPCPPDCHICHKMPVTDWFKWYAEAGR